MTRLRSHLLDQPEPMYMTAARAAIPANLLSAYSLGRLWPIPDQHLHRLADVLGCPPGDLVGFVDEPWLD